MFALSRDNILNRIVILFRLRIVERFYQNVQEDFAEGQGFISSKSPLVFHTNRMSTFTITSLYLYRKLRVSRRI